MEKFPFFDSADADATPQLAIQLQVVVV